MNLVEHTIESPRTLQRQHARTARLPSAARLAFALLETLPHGSLAVQLPDRTTRTFGAAPRTPDSGSRPSASIALHDWRVLADTLDRGDTGFAEAYIDGHWDTPDLVALLRVLASNPRRLDRAYYGAGVARWILRLRHLLNANTRAQAKRNILSHYDLGNAFYRLWLDDSMTYSSGLFDGDGSRTLEQAQHAKYCRLLDQLGLPPGAHILEVGCGWGGFAEVAARRGYRVTALSLSDAQTAYARDRLLGARLNERVEFRIEDYRDAAGRFDGIVSIEMFEAVGERWWPTYFRKLHALLRPGGRAALQTITIDDARFERYRRETDFIQQHVFPGGMLASRTRLIDESRAAGFELIDAHAFGGDYAITLKRWLAAFEAGVAAVRAQGFDERFIRCWRFYLAYCIAGFDAGSTDVGHYTFARA